MSKLFTTGEIAKLCGVSVRTVQYYDNRGLVVPSELSDGGRRLYAESDLNKMHVVCFLKELGMSLGSIEKLMKEKNSPKVIAMLLEEQEQNLIQTVKESEKRLAVLGELKKALRGESELNLKTIGDVAQSMKEKGKLKKMHWTMVLTGLPVSILQCAAIVLGITNGLWWLLGVWAVVAIPWGVIVSKYYFDHVAYVCPECHEKFKPRFKEAFWANHTPKTRKLVCPKCNTKSFCVEVYADEEKND